MSCFEGRMKEYPTISIDRYDKENVNARAYFLSHCHKDHMKGLRAPALKRRLKCSLTVRLYCSPVTKELLLTNPRYRFWENHIVAIEVETPTQISLIDEATGEKEDIVVTLLPAGHCPGSVMFLFEGSNGTVLYTGDFRLAKGEVTRMELLHSGSRIKYIKSVYLDTTFFDPRFYQIPDREECLKGIIDLVRSWITLSQYHVVWLNCKAAYGYEYLFTNLSEEFGIQVHVRYLDMFRNMPDILQHLTTNRETQIHACRHPKDDEFFRGNRLPCGIIAKDGTPLKIISIKPSTMWFGERTKKTNVIVRTGASSYRACFSFHSSYTEVRDFLMHISPAHAYPNVIPMGKTTEDIIEILQPFCMSNSRTEESMYKPLGALKRAKMMSYTTTDSDSEEGLFEEKLTVPWRRKIPNEKSNLPLCAETTSDNLPKSQISFCEDTANDYSMVASLPTFKNSYIDCEESNDDDDDDEEEEDEDTVECNADQTVNGGKPCVSHSHSVDSSLKKLETCCKETTEEITSQQNQAKKLKLDLDISKSELPKWESFFKPDPLTDSEQEDSQRQCVDLTRSQSPNLFSDTDNEESVCISSQNSSQSTHISEQGSECWGSQPDTVLISSQERKEHSVSAGQCNVTFCDFLKPQEIALNNFGKTTLEGREQLISLKSTQCLLIEDLATSSKIAAENTVPVQQSTCDSQDSSDFEIPSTPDSEVPQEEQLKDLYKRLAAGEMVIAKKSI
ncbi:DCR1C protein, partial [Polypterus senegalus]|nr:protein artemis isoform X2 [Polypterus senegalus]MBN3291050.1 DCR1C protein [Polypterus senegalus]